MQGGSSRLQEPNVDLFERKEEGCRGGKFVLMNEIAEQCEHTRGRMLQTKAKQRNLLKKENE